MSYGRVYLAGPITGLNYDGAQDWRRGAEEFLAEWDIEGMSPMRGKKYLEAVGIIEATSYGQPDGEWALSSASGFTSRDHGDCMRADVILANFEGADRVSIGTVLEVAWAHAYRKQLIVVMAEGNPHWHAMIRELAGYIVPTLAQGLDIIPAILNAKRTGAVDYRMTPHPTYPVPASDISPVHFDPERPFPYGPEDTHVGVSPDEGAFA